MKIDILKDALEYRLQWKKHTELGILQPLSDSQDYTLDHFSHWLHSKYYKAEAIWPDKTPSGE